MQSSKSKKRKPQPHRGINKLWETSKMTRKALLAVRLTRVYRTIGKTKHGRKNGKRFMHEARGRWYVNLIIPKYYSNLSRNKVSKSYAEFYTSKGKRLINLSEHYSADFYRWSQCFYWPRKLLTIKRRIYTLLRK